MYIYIYVYTLYTLYIYMYIIYIMYILYFQSTFHGHLTARPGLEHRYQDRKGTDRIGERFQDLDRVTAAKVPKSSVISSSKLT